MKTIIRKILRETDFDWVNNVSADLQGYVDGFPQFVVHIYNEDDFVGLMAIMGERGYTFPDYMVNSIESELEYDDAISVAFEVNRVGVGGETKYRMGYWSQMIDEYTLGEYLEESDDLVSKDFIGIFDNISDVEQYL